MEISTKSTENTKTELSLNDSNTNIPNIKALEVPLSKTNEKRSIKKQFCVYCHKLQTKFARHLLLKHKDESDVKHILTIPKGLPERRALIDTIRKKGNYLHNVNVEFNSGTLIAARQQNANSNNTAEDYICCKHCKVFLSKKKLFVYMLLNVMQIAIRVLAMSLYLENV